MKEIATKCTGRRGTSWGGSLLENIYVCSQDVRRRLLALLLKIRTMILLLFAGDCNSNYVIVIFVREHTNKLAAVSLWFFSDALIALGVIGQESDCCAKENGEISRKGSNIIGKAKVLEREREPLAVAWLFLWPNSHTGKLLLRERTRLLCNNLLCTCADRLRHTHTYCVIGRMSS